MAIYTVQVYINADTYVKKSTPSTNYGSSDELQLQKIYIDAQLTENCIILLKWDPNNVVPDRKRLISTKLYIYLNTDKESDKYVLARNPPLDFSEDTTVYNDRTDSGWDYETAAILWYNKGFTANQYISADGLSENSGFYFFNGSATLIAHSAQSNELKFASRESDNPPYWEVIYEDVPPDAPTPISPIGEYKDNTAVIRFEWQYNSSVGGSQTAFDLQWSSDNGNTWNTITEITANTYYDMPANTLPSGNIIWRVRTYNEYNEVGPYCDPVVFYAVGKPNTPTVTSITTGTARPVIEWSAFQQQIYQLQILQNGNVVHDTGNVPKMNERTHKVKAFLPDGNYTAQVRIKNEYGLWSDWGIKAFTVSTTKPQQANFYIYNTIYGLSLRLDTIPTGISYLLIYRAERDSEEYICIAKLDSATVQYNDNTVKNGQQYKYFIRAVTAEETYSDSEIKLGTGIFSYSLLAAISNLNDILVLKYTRTLNPDKQQNVGLNGEAKRYSGRRLPVTEFSEFEDNSLAVVFRLKSWADYEKFVQLVKKKETMLYRDNRGRKMCGNILSYQSQESMLGYIDISFTIVETDYNEEIEV